MSKTIRTRLDIPTPLARLGRRVDEGVPFRALEVYVSDIKARLPDEAEQKSCVIYGTEHMWPAYDNILTPAEELALRVNELEAARSAAMSLLPRDGEPLPPAVLVRLRELLG